MARAEDRNTLVLPTRGIPRSCLLIEIKKSAVLSQVIHWPRRMVRRRGTAEKPSSVTKDDQVRGRCEHMQVVGDEMILADAEALSAWSIFCGNPGFTPKVDESK